MDPRLLRHYNDELRFVREMGAEFAAAFPKIAGRLGLDTAEVADPYVERLLEGFAFLAARVQLKLDAQFPTFTQHVLDHVYPHYLAPTPSMAIVQFTPDAEGARLEGGYVVPRGTALTGQLPKGGVTACEFRTAHPVRLWPIAIAEVDYFATTSQLAALALPERHGAKAALRLRLKTTNGTPFSALSLKELCLFLQGGGGLPGAILEQLLADCLGMIGRPPTRPLPWQEFIPARAIRHVGLADDEAMLPFGARSFEGYRLLHEYFALPERTLFVELGGLGNVVRRATGTELELVILLRRAEKRLERRLSPDNFALFATPAINLFSRRVDRIHLSDKVPEHHVVPDRTRPLDLEIHTVLEVAGEFEGDVPPLPFKPLYSSSDQGGSEAYFTVRREPRLMSSRQKIKGARSGYLGSEVFLSLVDRNDAPYPSDLRQLSIQCLCTNRDLPLTMPLGKGDTDFTLETGAPVLATRAIAGPTRPRPSPVHGDVAWKLISHFTLNYLSITDADDGRGAEALRELLGLYAELGEPSVARQIDGVKSVSSTPIVRRLPGGGQAAIARGLEIAVTFDEAAFEGVGAFLLGAVLSHFFSKYVSINSFTETLVKTLDRGEVVRWPMMVGRRPSL